MAQKRIEQLFEELAKKYNKPVYVIEEIFNSQFKKLRKEINSLDFKTIKLPNWGKYIPSKDKLSKIKKYDLIKQNATKDNNNDALEGDKSGD